MFEFKTRLKELRKAKKMSQKHISSSIGVSNTQYQRYEYGEQEPTLKILVSLADFFDVSLDYLVGRTDTK